MTMPERRQSTPPSAFPAEAELSHPLYSFRCDQWFDHPTPNGPDWFSAEERARRDANAYAYRQHGTKENWFRYLYLGFFVFEDCFECDKLWAAMESDPLQVHRSIWYNFRFHVDQEMDIPPQLNAWAMNVSREYLSHYDPSTLHDTDTLAYSWKTMPFMTTPMDTDDQTDWIPVMGRRRSKSPPKSTDNEPPPTNNTTTVSPDRLLESLEDESPSSLALSAFKSATKQNPPKKKRFSKLSWSQGLPPVTTVTEDIEEEKEVDSQAMTDNPHPELASENSVPTQLKSSPFPNIPTNDGTHRVNVKWTPPENTHAYEKDKKKLNEAIYDIVQELIPHEVGILYRWESEDLSVSKSAPSMIAEELRDFITPVITIVHSQRQIIFGLRIGFSITPGQWLRSNITAGVLKAKRVELSISNSKSTSGKMVIAGYVLLKAPNTTQLHRYTQFLRSVLPTNTPYFDIVRYKKSPMDQLIPHLRIQCGEKHVMPLCHALLPVLTGHGSALFIPRYALGTMTDGKIRSHFQVHERWARSLKAIPMTPTINHLDQARIEYNADGTTIERSTREWAATILAVDNVSPALCDVVNGPPDHKAYLLVPSQYLQKVQQEWRSYKSRLYPPNQREARYRDKIPGLPDVIHIQAEIAANVSFLDKLSTAAGWHDNIQEQVSTFPNARAEGEVNRAQNHISKRRSEGSPEWPTPMEASNPMRPLRNAWKTKQGQVAADLNSAGGDTSIGTDEDRSAGSTHSLTHASRTSSDTKFLALERSMKKKLEALDVSGRKSSMRLQSIEQQFTRIDEFDKKLAAVSDKVEKATEQIEKSGELQKHISADMEEMKVLTEKQFTEMNNRLLTNMECQHKMSTTMLDLHAHFEKLSAFMEGLATKMEFDREPGPITAVASMDKPPSKSVLSQRHVTDLCSTSSASSASGSSQSNAQSVTSSASSKVYCSPEKKKQRSHRKLGNKKQQHDHSHQVYSSNDSPGCNSEVELMEVCTNLDEAFDSPDIISSPAQVNLPPHDPSMSPVLTQPTPYPLPAPLDSQYTYPSDQAGATEA